MTDNGQKKEPIGELMLRENLITKEKLNEAIARKIKLGGKIGENLVEVGALPDWELAAFLGRQFNIEVLQENQEPQKEVLKLFTPDFIKRYQFVPIDKVGGLLYIATSDPMDIRMIDDIKFAVSGVTGVEIFVATPNHIRSLIEKFFTDGSSALEKMLSSINEQDDIEFIQTDEENSADAVTEEDAKAAPVVKMLNMLLKHAIDNRASDIHFEPMENGLLVRNRVDGILYKHIFLPNKFKRLIISRLKIIANLKIDETRRPQDGHIKMKIDREQVEFRVAVVPTIQGEKVTLRVMDNSKIIRKLDQLGFEEQTFKLFRDSLNYQNGIVLVTGQTGSGKTTTLYSALNELNTEDVHIITAEDPVEMSIPGIIQVQINPAVELNFAECIRQFLRQDPDIIFVGEIRDFETAETAIKAAITGHLVFSTLHTNDAASTIMRLRDIGIEPHLINAGVRMVLAQKLLRLPCGNCKREAKIDIDKLTQMGMAEEEAKTAKIFSAPGCNFCNNTGYKGRTAIYEIMPITERIKKLIHNDASVGEITAAAAQEGMITLKQAALMKLHAGMTTIEEVLGNT